MRSMADTYYHSAEIVGERIKSLKEMQKSKAFTNQKKLEDRITILNAEYYYLLRTAKYLKNYYDKEPVRRDAKWQ